MQSDRELLELAAKAAGLTIVHMPLSGPGILEGPGMGSSWNPLTDDGDALRLACELRIHVGFFRGMVAVQGPKGGQKSVPIRENGAGEPTRRAIVLAAAEIGIQTKEVNDAN
ncbi:hypothetical protein DXK93_27195 [Achromobacter sp. K91]|uniref:hypothetical protein n=1 Tax=Achromobacter sp. K91 TaxID=2292262 RepID=UPI000E660EB4|nr:hypothetical protein [Achromobacter sp. K91]RIJ00250.1 hypothetical protein DXK93_27195 [Achromobacter sp. K91]